ncbi:MAG: mannitol-1-phosphate 5-dehydrogenase [Ruminococcaceae bacterium]|nr:mannitol-1-phosphate 5-dehydrogenase [Oscillospiraceae bacterium]
MNKAIMFGGGNIGRGFIGLLLEKAGYHVLFADVFQPLLDAINTRKEYTVHIVDENCEDVVVSNISAMNSTAPELANEFVDAQLVTTAVGLTILPRIAGTFAAGIAARRAAGVKTYMNIIACENAIRASSQLKAHVYDRLSDEDKTYADEFVGFPDCVVDRIVPPFRSENITDVMVERHCEWDVERAGIKGDFNGLNGMEIVDKLEPYLERKLYGFNGPHCITACLGCVKGHNTIRQSINDPEIEKIVTGVMAECSAALCKRHGFAPEAMAAYSATAINRFRNPYLVDEVKRVAREPMRKLAPNDRLVGPMKMAMEYDLPVDNYAIGVAAAMLYDNPEDPQSVQLQALIADKGVIGALTEITGIAGEAAEKVLAAYNSMK